VVAGLPAGGVEAAKVLVSAGAPVDGTDFAAHTALWHAVTASNREMAVFLLEVGAATDDCLHPAIDTGDEELVRELIDCGADLGETADGETALDHARRLGFEQAERLIEEELQRRS
jgi:ankyrin repeat protein